MSFIFSSPVGMMIGVFCILLLLAGLKKDAVIHVILTSTHRITNSAGKAISGPHWQWANGQLIEKFLVGRQKSFLWQRYGPVYRIWSCTIPEIVITTPEDVREFHSDSSQHNKAKASNAGWYFHQILGDCLGLINGQRWEQLRAQVEPPFSHQASSARLPETMAQAKEFVRGIGQNHTGDQKDFKMNVIAGFMKFPLFHTADVIYGCLTKEEQERFWSIGQSRLALLRHVVAGGIFRFEACRWLAKNALDELAMHTERWTEFNRDIYRSRKLSNPTAPIVSLWESASTEGRKHTEALQTLDEMLFANLDVTTHVLTWIITLLADDESTQNELRREVRANADHGRDYLNKKDSLMHYCFLESIRVRPISAFSVPESSPSVKILGGFTIPKNTDVVVDTMAINIRNSFWGTDATKFSPHRFENIKPSQLRYNLFVYGFGTRKCLGQHDAERAVKALLFHLVSEYSWTMGFDQRKDGDFKVDEGNWVPLADVDLVFTKLLL